MPKLTKEMNKRRFAYLLLWMAGNGFSPSTLGQHNTALPDQQLLAGYSATLENDVLTLANASISRTYKWNGGNLITLSLTDKVNKKVWQMEGKKPDLALPGEADSAAHGAFTAAVMAATAVAPAHLEAEVVYALGSLWIKRVFRLYANCPAIACDVYVKGSSAHAWLQAGTNLADMVNLERLTSAGAVTNTPVIEKLALPGKHWQLNAVEFFDVTDRFNTLVKCDRTLSYRQNAYRGNLLFARDNTSGNGVFLLKEAPTSNVQLAYPGGDFITEYGTFRVIGVGLQPADLDTALWKRGYGFVTGVYAGEELNGLLALRSYQANLRLHQPGRDEMVMMNTWGDRGQDSRIRESFALAELEAGEKLGISHFQLDDGWQTGRSSNSAVKGGSLNGIWNNTNYWEPNPVKFPNGLEPIIKKGRELGIETCLWFNPSGDNNNENWEKDANTLIGLNKKYGIRTFKIDGVNLHTKTAEINFRKFLDKVSRETDRKVVFNLDVTAGWRGGYHYFNEYGNIFLENRYTDWQNYYPYTTLRNLWMLSRYIPPQNLQIEFLNKWRNADKYTADPYAPARYSFDYLFAIAMVAQPLAWFEGTGLPAEAFTTVAPVVRKYRQIQQDLHASSIFPIGDEPSGASFTGFQAVQKGRGYFVIFREATGQSTGLVKTWLQPGKRVTCTPVLGSGKSFTGISGVDGSIPFFMPATNSYAVYRYVVE